MKAFGRGPKAARMDEDGWLEAWERKILILPWKMKVFVGTSGDKMHWKRKTLVFLQENAHVWTQKMFSWMHGGAKY